MVLQFDPSLTFKKIDLDANKIVEMIRAARFVKFCYNNSIGGLEYLGSSFELEEFTNEC